MSKDLVFATAYQRRILSNSVSVYSKLSGRLRSHAIAASLIVLFCSTSVRGFLTWRADPLEMVNGAIPDSTTYLMPARNFFERGAFLDATGRPEITRTPGYPAFLAGVMLFVGSDLRAILITQAAILSSGVVILYWFARRVLPPPMAFTGALIAAISPWGAVLAGIPTSDGLFLFLLSLIFFVMKLTEEAHSSRLLLGGVFIGLLTGAAVLVRPLWPLCILIPGAFLWSYGPNRKGVWLLLTVTLVVAVLPVELWRERNQREAQFSQLSDIAGKTVFRYLAARVQAEVNGQNRHAASELAYEEERHWNLPRLEADKERWKRAKAVFREHPFLTGYSFARSATEHMIHPSPDVLRPAKLNFHGDLVTLALVWGGLLMFACVGWRSTPNLEDDGEIDRRWLSTLLVVCLVLTLLSGMSFAAGSRLRAPMEAIVPLLAAVGLVRAIRVVSCSFSAYKGRKNPAIRGAI
jgi:4-amino-4-deoxy-L-arabinose transferase-like glycosyltransferase